VRIATATLAYCLLAQSALADTVTYQQLQQNPAAREASPPGRTADQSSQQKTQGQQSAQTSGQQAGTAQESPNHPEFVRLPDGRIVRYGPGVLCDENCVEPVTPAAFREPGPNLWWIPPVVAGGILCAILCRPGGEQPQPTPTIIIPPSPVVSPTAAPTVQPTPPPDEIPEPGTLVLLGLGLGTMIARRRMRGKQEQS
jgi:hypothetical protein